MSMTFEEFLRGMDVLYAFGLKQKEDFELKYWYQALYDEMNFDSFKKCCIHLCKKNEKFWETDNIPAQLLSTYEEIKQEITTKLIAQRSEDDQRRRDRERQEAVDSYESEEDRLRCIEEFKEMNRKVFRSISS
ncbi:MAG: hypothetical protein KAV87_12900 [Desulfobacteraceae bacterium]|nr:hypothetical protein [Desulfobacteraceae bacterium]